MKILVVDDEKLLVKGIKFNLENDGYEVVTGCDGMEAVELAVALFLVVADLCRSDGKNGRCVAFAHSFTSLAVKRKRAGRSPPLSVIRWSGPQC